MKSALLIISILISGSSFANDKKLLECSDKYNSLTVTVNNESGQVNILRNPWQRGLMYVDRKDQAEENPVVVHGYENLEYSALLSNAKAIVNGSAIEITFEDKQATKIKIIVEKIKEGQGVIILLRLGEARVNLTKIYIAVRIGQQFFYGNYIAHDKFISRFTHYKT